MGYEEDSQRFGEDSDFNAGIATLRRLDEIKKHLAAATVEEDVYLQFKYCKAFFKELDCMLSNAKAKTKGNNKSEREIHIAFYSELKEAREKYSNQKLNQSDFIDMLDEWEMALRKAEQDHSLNMPMGKDARWALSNRRK